MDRKEKEEKRKRWEQIVDLAEQREADMRAGKGADGRRKGLSEEWIESKEEVSESVRNAVKLAMGATEATDRPGNSNGSDDSVSDSESDHDGDNDIMELDQDGMAKLREEAEAGDIDAIWVLKNQVRIPSQYLPTAKVPRRFAGFDEDESLSSEDEDADLSTEPPMEEKVGKITA
jgi:hypothetical protein